MCELVRVVVRRRIIFIFSCRWAAPGEVGRWSGVDLLSLTKVNSLPQRSSAVEEKSDGWLYAKDFHSVQTPQCGWCWLKGGHLSVDTVIMKKCKWIVISTVADCDGTVRVEGEVL